MAIVPLAKLLAWGTEELALRVGQTLGGLLSATCTCGYYYFAWLALMSRFIFHCAVGNVVELIVGVIALAYVSLLTRPSGKLMGHSNYPDDFRRRHLCGWIQSLRPTMDCIIANLHAPYMWLAFSNAAANAS